MDIRFQLHNIFRDSIVDFDRMDPHLRQLRDQPFVYWSRLLNQIDPTKVGIYTLTGGRQVGKSTFLKQYIRFLIERQIDARTIYFVSCELINDFQDLVYVLERFLETVSTAEIAYVFVDEVTYVPQWDRAIKHLADTGQLERIFLMISGSDSTIIRAAMMRFPGRRGSAREIDFRYHPLTFYEFLTLRNHLPFDWIRSLRKAKISVLSGLLDQALIQNLFNEFEVYSSTGGYLTAINDLELKGTISFSTFRTYSDWIRGDLIRQGKSEAYLKELLRAILKRYGTQISWNNLTSDLSIDHPATVADYFHRLESMEVVMIQQALQEHTLTASPKKAKKLYFRDPFIYHAIDAWITGSVNPFEERVRSHLQDSEYMSTLVEGITVSHYSRSGPSFYIKGKGEVDIATIKNNRIHPLEIKWRSQIRKSDIKELLRFPNGLIATRAHQMSTAFGRPNIPLPVLLARV